jgi:hypothetical protein
MKAIIVALSTATLLWVAPTTLAAAPEPTAAKAPAPDSPGFAIWVLTRTDDLYRGAKSHTVMAMTVKTKHWTRKLEMEGWSLGKHYSLTRILSPKKERGTASLKARKNLFTYLGKTKRVIKITSGMMGGSWMGSHFTNDDLMRESRLSEDFTITRLDKCPSTSWCFLLVPKPDLPIVWGKIVVQTSKARLMPQKQTFFDEDGKAVRELAFSKVKTIGKRTLPTRMLMTPLDKKGEFTEVEFTKLDFAVKLSKSFFTLQKLKSL